VAKLKKKQRVEKYLNQLMKGRLFTVDDLLSLTIRDLQENTPLLDISRPTIAGVLKTYKEKYKTKKTKPVPSNKKKILAKTNTDLSNLLPEEIVKVRKMIDSFDTQMEDVLTTFEELKSALSDIGMDYHKLLAQYRVKA
jgi:hypothetical protein